MNDAVLELQNVSVHFSQSGPMRLGRSETVHAVDDVSVSVGENDVLCLVGESGCGKTTLGKTAVGLQRPTDGEVLYRGQDFWETKDRASRFWQRGSKNGHYSYEEMRRNLQIVHQDASSSLSGNHTVETILSEPLKRWHRDLSADDRRARIYGLLDFVGMTPASDYASRYPHQLSGGEQQRIALIRTLLMNPEVILADESVSSLDVSLRIEMMDLMLKLQNEINTSYIFIAHDLGNARYIAKRAGGRIGIMYLGELVEIGPVDQIMDNPKHPYTKVLRWATPNLFEDMTAEEPPVRGLDIPEPVDPPSGCRFHTRCPYAHETCAQQTPELESVDGAQPAACFRQYDLSHEYWGTDPLPGVDEEELSI